MKTAIEEELRMFDISEEIGPRVSSARRSADRRHQGLRFIQQARQDCPSTKRRWPSLAAYVDRDLAARRSKLIEEEAPTFGSETKGVTGDR